MIYCFVFPRRVSRMLFFKNDVFGIIHIAGKEQISKYEFGYLIASEFNLDKSLIKKYDLKPIETYDLMNP